MAVEGAGTLPLDKPFNAAMISEPANIAALFSILHDGTIDSFSRVGNTATLKVGIRYLAAQLDPSFEGFTVTLTDVTGMTFSTWPTDPTASPRTLTDDTMIFVGELQILSGQDHGQQTKVLCTQFATQYGYFGGELCFTARSAQVQDESKRMWRIPELDTLSQAYWNDWARRNRR
ncbi:hypothetical protein E4K72_14250 [Oxalobacteraceae bacterium OM1]|nr:hypothetical protein E4K72_14250 [Oxalobacteraceae bacterium OM1]